jgi:hypothetical protein
MCVQVTTTFDFDLSETITSGSVVYSGSYNGMPFSQDADLCTEVAKSGDPCPLSVGHHKQVSTATADYTGKVETKINWTTTDGRAILCADVTVSLRPCSMRAARQSVPPCCIFRPVNTSRQSTCTLSLTTPTPSCTPVSRARAGQGCISGLQRARVACRALRCTWFGSGNH